MILSRLLILTGFLQCLATDGISVNSFSSRNVAKIRSLLKGIENQNEADEAIIVLFKSPNLDAHQRVTVSADAAARTSISLSSIEHLPEISTAESPTRI
uniref:Uncharacterized protein n=1 Tax=Solanum lycopersicum TaxID=4081 RepID=A0A3Q7J2V1_SOLLC